MHKPDAPSSGGWLFIPYATIWVSVLIVAVASDGSPAGLVGSFAEALVLSFIVWWVIAAAFPHGE